MSRKSKKRPRQRKLAVPAKFFTDTQVRVKPGTTDPDFTDIPLGGWSGTITEVDTRSNPPTYLIDWDQRTLSRMHSVYRNRCERDGLGVESTWLHENDIEPDNGDPAPIEQPTRIVTRPLKISYQDDRIRAIFDLTSDDSLPPVTEANLSRYHDFLAENTAVRLRFSVFDATCATTII